MEQKIILLIIDDDPNVCASIKRDLEHTQRYIVHEANSGAAGFALACNVLPDIIVLDMMMPMMTGAECSRLLREEPLTTHIPVIYLTGMMSKADANAYDGMIDGERYLAKPACIKEIMSAVELELAKRG
jgi:Response regulator containing a CheY-like receiver domain and an HD-GYP domain